MRWKNLLGVRLKEMSLMLHVAEREKTDVRRSGEP